MRGFAFPAALPPRRSRFASSWRKAISPPGSRAGLASLDIDDVPALARAGAEIRGWIAAAPLPPALESEIAAAYRQLAEASPAATFAVRSSATAEDLPEASFAGQQETFLNIRGLENVVHAIREVYASLYNDRAIAYRVHQKFDHADVALSAGVQQMVRSDEGAAGVMFTLDTESGFDQVVFITSSYGLGETVVQGAVNPDEFYVYKPNLAAGKPALLRKTLGAKALRMIFAGAERAGKSTKTVEVSEEDRRRFSITDAEAHELARFAITIEKHYRRPMDIEWGRDGVDWQALHPASSAGDREVARKRRQPAPLSGSSPRPMCSPPAGRSARKSGPASSAS
jgi:pyruvate,water dikinase